MITVKRENVIYSISEDEKSEYLKKGYSLLDSKGKEIKEQKKNNNKENAELLKQVKELTEQVDTLTKEKESLVAENTSLTEQVDALTSEVEELKASSQNTDSQKKEEE